MTLVKVDLGDVAGGHHPDDYVTIRAEAFRESQGGGITSTAEVKIPLVDGVGQAEVEPGPVVVSFRCQAVADTREKRGVVPDEGPVGIERVLEAAFEYLPPVVNRALETIKGAVAAEVDAIKWSKTATLLQGTEDLLTIREGWYRAEVAGATALGLPKTTAFDPPLQIGGFLLVLSRTTTRTLLWITGHNRPQLWANNANQNGFTGWSFIGGVHNVDSLVVKGIISAADADSLKSRAESGFYSVSGIGTNPTTATPPTNFSQVMLNASQVDNGAQMQVAAATHPTDAGLYYRTAPAGSTRNFQMWQRVMGEGQSPTLNRGALMREELQEQWGGRIYTGTAVPVALTWDDFPRDFRDHVLPMLIARGLPSTVALSSKMYDAAAAPGIAPGAEGTTWAEINAWPEYITIANHSATHTSATHRYAMYQEIVQGRIDLQNALPAKKILTWIQPSVTYDPQFNNGASGEAYASTIAGHMILGNHAFATGSRRVDGRSGCYMENGAMQGLARNWIDSGNGIANAKASISTMRGDKRGIVIGAHADRFLRGVGFPTLAELEEFLDWLVAEQAAGRVRVMNLEQFSIARYGTPPVRDTGVRRLLPSQGWSGDLFLRRTGNTVNIWGRVQSEEGAPVGVTGIPVGFRHISTGAVVNTFHVYQVNSTDVCRANTYNGTLSIVGAQTRVSYEFNVRFQTADAWPTVLP